jgi:hypothetical protein
VTLFAFGETVTRQRGDGVTDPYSGEATELNWDSPDELEIDGVAVAPGAFVESATPDRTRVDIDFTLCGPYEADIEPLDRVIVRGHTCEVIGKRQDWLNPFTGNQAGCVAEVRKVAG